MKKLILSLAVLSTALAFGQKREINAAFKAIEAGNVTEAKMQVAAAESAIGTNYASVNPELLEKFYYAKGVSLIKSGNTAEGANVLAKISDLKTDKFTPSLNSKLGELINPLLQSVNKEAMTAYDAKKYDVAAPKFREIYDLLKAAGQDNKQYLYYSAIAYSQGNNTDKAHEVYSDLINSGYTGVTTTYIAKEKKTGQVVAFDKTNWDLLKKTNSPDYTDFKTEVTKSVEQELYENDAVMLVNANKYEEALKVIEAGLKKFPESKKLSELQGTTYFKLGKTDEFIKNLKEQVAKNPNDKASWYNLGVLASKDPSKIGEAETYFKKSLEIDPNYIPSLQAIFYNIYMGDDQKVINSAEEARKAKKMDTYNKILEDRRERFAKGLAYVEKWYSLEPNNPDVISLLKGLYQTTKNESKYQEFKAKEAALKSK